LDVAEALVCGQCVRSRKLLDKAVLLDFVIEVVRKLRY
jgi:hypothetical protein